MSIIDTLITDRTQEDVTALKTAMEHVIDGTATEEEAELVQSPFSRGAYNYTDLNRVTEAIEYLVGRLEDMGYSVPYTPIEVEHSIPGENVQEQTTYRYIRFRVDSIRGTGTTVQFSELQFLDTNGNVFAYPSSANVTATISATGDSEGPSKIIDGNLDTKFCSTAFKSGFYLTIDLGDGKSIDIKKYKKWQYFTANDSSERDPISFALLVSNDGSNFIALNTVSGATITETRKAVGYTAEIPIVEDYTELEYIRSNGAQFIDTQFKPTQNTRLIMDVDIISATSPGGTPAIFGGRSGTNVDAFAMWAVSATSFRSDFGASNVTGSANLIGHVLIDKNKSKAQFGDVSVSNTASVFQSNSSLCLLAINSGGVIDPRMITAKLRKAQLYDGESLIRYFIPCKLSSGEIGLIDKVTRLFFGNPGSGAFTAGPEYIPDATKDPHLWYEEDYMKPEQAQIYLTNIASIRTALTMLRDVPDIPESMGKINVQVANNIETILIAVEDALNRIQTSYIYCNEAYCGEV